MADQRNERPSRKPRVEQTLWYLDAAELDLNRLSAWPGYTDNLEWRSSITGQVLLTLGVIFTHQQGPVLVLHNNGWVRNRFKLSCTTPNYGGQRWWLHCPKCQKRVRILLVNEFPQFLCRTCLGLAYETQLLREDKRALRKVRAIHRQLGSDSSVHEPLPPRPPGMHRQKYLKLAEKESIAAQVYLTYERRRIEKKVGPLEELLRSRSQ